VKNRGFRARLGFALSGIVAAAARERSFRSQIALGSLGLLAILALRPPLVWVGLFVVAASLVLALELVNSALEALIDRLHPDVHPEIRAAKDMAAGAVLVASAGAALVGIMLVWAAV
jgi:diacylglycerol kinase (ATP)